MKEDENEKTPAPETTNLLLATNSDLKNKNDQSKQNANKTSPLQDLKTARRLLYVSHLFAKASEVAWQFCLALFLAAFTNYDSLILVSTYGLLTGLTVCLTGEIVGTFVDAMPRIFVARFFIWTQNCCVLLATFFCYFLLSSDTQNIYEVKDGEGSWVPNWIRSRLVGVPTSAWSIVLLVGVHVFGAAANVLDKGFTVAIERDWVVVMSKVAGFDETRWVEDDTTIREQLCNEDELQGNGDNETTRRRQQQQQQQQLHEKTTTVTTKEQDEDQMAAVAAQKIKLWLSETNVAMTQIDLSCQVLAPAGAGFFIAFYGDNNTSSTIQGSSSQDLGGAALLVGVLNAACLVVEYICTAMIYNLVPELGIEKKKEDEEQRDTKQNGEESNVEANPSLEDQNINPNAECSDVVNGDAKSRMEVLEISMETVSETRASKKFSCGCLRLPSGMQIYMEQPVAWGGLALALLYLNMLSFGTLMTAYLVWRGMRLETIGVWRGVSCLIGLTGTVAYNISSSKISLEGTGMWSIIFQFVCLTLSYASLFVQDYSTSLTLLIFGVCASRVGLWVFDITITQLMQELVPEGVRGVVGSTQQALHALFELLIYVLGILFPDPNQFHILVTAGYGSVGVALMFYAFGVYGKRDKLRMHLL